MDFVPLVLVAVLQASIPSVYGAASPALLWPLGDKTLAYDVMTGNDAIYPNLTRCMTFAEGEPSLGFSALLMNGTAGKAYVEVPVPQGIVSGSFSIGVSVFAPSSPTGPLLHYLAQPGSAGFTQFKVIIGSSTALSYAGETPTSMWSGSALTSAFRPSAGVWMRYTLTLDVATGNLTLYKDGTVVLSKATSRIGETLATPGKLRIATDGSDYLVARVTCASIHSSVLPVSELSQVLSACALRAGGWNFNPPHPPCTPDSTTAAPTIATTATVLSTPVHVVALNNVTFAYDVIGYHAPSYVTKSRCTRLTSGHPSLPFSQATLFDGSTVNVATLPVAMATLQGDFTVTIYVMANVSTRGVLWEISGQGQTPGINKIRLELHGPDLTFSLYDVTSGLCGSAQVNGAVVAGSWKRVVSQREATTGSIKLTIDSGSSVTVADTCIHVASASATGSMRIGGDGSRDNCIRATLQCLTVFPSSIDVTSGVIEDTCSKVTSELHPPNATDICWTADTYRTQKSVLLQRDRAPNVSYGPFAEVTTRSRKTCAVLCLETATCRSFLTKDTGSGSGVECKLYDYVTVTQFSALNGAKYFVQVY